jgi:hypothetical protein
MPGAGSPQLSEGAVWILRPGCLAWSHGIPRAPSGDGDRRVARFETRVNGTKVISDRGRRARLRGEGVRGRPGVGKAAIGGGAMAWRLIQLVALRLVADRRPPEIASETKLEDKRQSVGRPRA